MLLRSSGAVTTRGRVKARKKKAAAKQLEIDNLAKVAAQQYELPCLAKSAAVELDLPHLAKSAAEAAAGQLVPVAKSGGSFGMKEVEPRSMATQVACSGKGKGGLVLPEADAVVLERRLQWIRGQVGLVSLFRGCEHMECLNDLRHLAASVKPLVFVSGSILLVALLEDVLACLMEV